ncbi:MAG: Na+/H+ antiporter subunit E [Acidimicrobiales bacterium]
MIGRLRSSGNLLAAVALAAAWCALWGEATLGNIVAGLGLGLALIAVFGPPSKPGVRIVPLVALAGAIMRDLVESTVAVAREVLTPTDYTDERYVTVALGEVGRRHLLLIASAVTLTPGTAVVDVDDSTGAVVLHLLHGHREPDTVAHVHRLAELADHAFPSGVAR